VVSRFLRGVARVSNASDEIVLCDLKVSSLEVGNLSLNPVKILGTCPHPEDIAGIRPRQ
jgi:hypothetical protein